MILEAMRVVSAKDEEDLADVTTSMRAGHLRRQHTPKIRIFPLVMETTEHGDALHSVIAGTTFPFKDELKKAGVSFSCKKLNDVDGAMGWLRLEPARPSWRSPTTISRRSSRSEASSLKSTMALTRRNRRRALSLGLGFGSSRSRHLQPGACQGACV